MSEKKLNERVGEVDFIDELNHMFKCRFN